MKKYITNFLHAARTAITVERESFLFILIFCMSIMLQSKKATAQTAPFIEWQKSYKPTTHVNNPTLAGLDEDWFYDLKPSYSGGIQDGYIACGYSGNLNFPDPPPYPFPTAFDAIVKRYSELETTAYNKSQSVHKIAKLDLKGNVVWYKVAGIDYAGFLHKIIQLSDGSYVAVGYVVNNITKYNPNLIYPAGQTEIAPLTPSIKQRHTYVVKYDNNGNKLWDFQYGLEDDVTKTFLFNTKSWGVVETEDNNIVIVTEDLNSNISYTNLCNADANYPVERLGLIKINANNGQIVWKEGYGYDDAGNPVVTKGSSINKKGNKYIVTGNILPKNYCKDFAGDYPNSQVYLLSFTGSSSAPNPILATQRKISQSTPDKNDLVTDAAIDNNDDIIVPAIIGSSRGFYDAHGFDAQVKIYKLDFSTLNTIASAVPTTKLLAAYDLKLGVCTATDGGFAITTSVQNPAWWLTESPTMINDMGHTIILDPNNFDQVSIDGVSHSISINENKSLFWYNNVYVAKYNSTMTKEWDREFDNASPHASTWPGDLRRAECVYDINQTQDGGYIIGGNNSEDFDNDYAIKLKVPCPLPTGGEILVDNYIVSGNEVWTTPHIVTGTITISPFSTLSINNTNIKFADTKQWNDANPGVDPTKPFKPIRMIIDHPASLILNNSTLTSLDDCNAMWDGIIVKGNKTTSQDDITGFISQGKIIMNNSTISNAREAIQLWNPEAGWISANNTDNQGETGGIVQATNSNFINNTRSVEFMYYKNIETGGSIELPNASFFTNCNFIVNNDYRNNDKPLNAHISAWGVRGINIKACVFANNKTGITNSAELGHGISTIDANYTVSNNGSRRSTFSNLSFGILSSNSYKSATQVNVLRAAFSYNQWGLYLCNTDQSTVKGSTFTVGKLAIAGPPNPATYIVGSGLVNSSQFTFEDNYFIGANTVTNNTIGQWFINTGLGASAECESKYSVIQNIPYASLANMYNRMKTDGIVEGLQFRCHQNSGNTKDFTVWNVGDCPDCGIRDNQGLPGNYLNNTFSLGSSAVFANHDNQENNNIDYHVHSAFPVYIPDPAKINPAHFSVRYSASLPNLCLTKSIKPVDAANVLDPGNVNPNIVLNPSGDDDYLYSGLAWVSTSDITKLSIPDRILKEGSFLTHKNAYNAYRLQLANLIDGGSTEDLLIAIAASTTANQASTLRNQLLSNSPYLSEEVLAEVLENNALNLAAIFEILSANPSAGQSETVLLKMQSLGLPQWMIDYIVSNTGTLNARKLVEFAISNEHEQMMADSRIIIQDIINDPAGLNHASYRGWLGLLDDIEADYTIVDDYIETGDYSTAQNMMSDLPNNYTLNEKQLAQYASLNIFNNWRIELLSNGGAYQHLNEIQLSALHEIANNEENSASQRAKNILNYFYTENYLVYPEVPTANGQRKANPVKTAIASDPKSLVTIYPNPAKDILYLECQIPYTAGKTVLEISDMNGKTVQEITLIKDIRQYTVDIQHYTSGTYNYTINCGGLITAVGKFAVVK